MPWSLYTIQDPAYPLNTEKPSAHVLMIDRVKLLMRIVTEMTEEIRLKKDWAKKTATVFISYKNAAKL